MIAELKAFLIANNLLTTMAGVTIGFSTGVMIRSLVGDIILPLMYAAILQRFKRTSSAFAPISKMNLDNFLKDFISWIFVILFTFFLIEYLLRKSFLKTMPQSHAVGQETKRNDSASAAAAAADAGGVERFYGGRARF